MSSNLTSSFFYKENFQFMMPFFVGVKLGMTSLYNEDGNACAVTIIKIVPVKVTKILNF